MKTNIKVSIDELHRAFYEFNKRLFNNELPEPAILIQSKGNRKNVLGWCSTNEIWVSRDEKVKKYEINLVAEYLNRSIFEVMATLLHEMIHLYALVNEIQDTSREGTYHNKKFKQIAERHGLIIKHHKLIGWSLTALKEDTKKLIKELNFKEEAFGISRIEFESYKIVDGEVIKLKKKSSSRKYVCPSCGNIVRATKEVNIICGDCKVEFKLNNDEN